MVLTINDLENDQLSLGLPDWTDASAYPTAQSSALRFAWEFLRRNEKYRELWARYQAEPANHRIIQLTALVDFNVFDFADPQLPFSSILEHELFLNPLDKGGMADRFLTTQYLCEKAEPLRIGLLPRHRREVVVRLHVGGIETQLKWLGKKLRKLESSLGNSSKPQARKLRLYLRLLDAVDQKATPQQIEEQLFSEVSLGDKNDSADLRKKGLKRGTVVRDRGFLALIDRGREEHGLFRLTLDDAKAATLIDSVLDEEPES